MSSGNVSLPMTTRENVISYFNFYPAEAPALVFLVLFMTMAVISAGLNIKFRSWFMFVATATAFLEGVGYIARVIMLTSPAYGTYVVMQVFLIITPTLLAVLDYMIVGRLIIISGVDRVCYLKPSWIARVFGASDVVSLVVQSSGTVMLVGTNTGNNALGIKLVNAGLILQVLFFACFTAITIYVHVTKRFGLAHLPGANRLFFSLYASVVLLVTRNIFRVVEFKQGFNGYLPDHEKYLFGFDSSLVLSAVVVLTVFHAGWLLPKMAVSRVAASEEVVEGSDASQGDVESAPALIKAAPL